MGVDVGGREMHVVIREQDFGQAETWRLVFAATVPSFEALDDLIVRYRVEQCVIDALPDQHKAREFCAQPRQDCQAWICYYDRERGDHHWDAPARTVHANRTLLLDQVFDRFRRRLNLLPRDARWLGGNVGSGVGEYYRQLIAPVRVVAPDNTGNPVARYKHRGKPDHFAHAEAYCYLATVEPVAPRKPGFSFASLDPQW